MKRIIPFAAVMLLISLLCACGTVEIKTPGKVWTDGVISDGVYTNECLQMSFQIPDRWIEATEEETRSILNAAETDKTTIYDTLIGSPTDFGKMFVICMDLTRTIGGNRLTEEELLQSIVEDLGTDPDMNGFQGSEMSVATVCGLGYSYCDVFADEVIERIFIRKISDTELVMLGVVATNEMQLQYYMGHFTDDPEKIPDFPGTMTVDSDSGFSRGKISGGVYSSEYLGLSFAPPEDWIYATDKELSELMGISMDIVGEDIYGDSKELAEQFAKQAAIYDMVAAAPNGSNVQIVLEDLTKTIGGSSLTALEYADIVCTQLAAIDDYTYALSEPYAGSLAGKSFVVVDASMAESDMQQQIWLLRVEKYMLCITFTAIGEENVSDYAGYFMQS